MGILFIYLLTRKSKEDTEQYITQHEQQNKARKNTTKNQYRMKQYYYTHKALFTKKMVETQNTTKLRLKTLKPMQVTFEGRET